MLYFLHYFEEYFGPARLFEYITVRAAGATMTAFLLVVLLGGFTARKLKSLNTLAADRYEGLRDPAEIDKIKNRTPSMGGILLIGAIIVSSLLWMNISNVVSLVLIISIFEFALIGFYDDYCKVFKKNKDGISSIRKFTLLSIVAISIVATLVFVPATKSLMDKTFIPFIKEPVYISYLGSMVLAILAILGAANGVNFTDGKDGLAVGCMIVSTLTFSLFAYFMGHSIYASYLNFPVISGAGETMIFGGAIVGACVGFLWHNCHPASMFMGDTGSLALGGALGAIAVILRQEVLLILIGGVFVAEVTSVMIQVTSFKLFKKRVFRCSPIHHHFEKSWGGKWEENQIVVRFWIIAGILSMLALATLKLR